MKDTIDFIPEMTLINQIMKMNFSNNNIFVLFKSLMTSKNEIKILQTNEFISTDLYNLSFEFINRILISSSYNITSLEVCHGKNIPLKMKFEQILKGIDAVFHSIRLHSDPAIYQYVSEEWLLKSEHMFNAQHPIAILADKFQYTYPNSEKDICISIWMKKQTKPIKIELSTT